MYAEVFTATSQPPRSLGYVNSPSCDDRPLSLHPRIPESVVVFARYGLVVATYPVPPHRAPAPTAERGTEQAADLLFSTAIGVVAMLAIAAGLVWLAAVCSA